MGEHCERPGWRSSWAVAVMLATVAVALAQAPRPGRVTRGQQRNRGGEPLKKARPEAGDPLAKVAGAVPVRPAPGTFHYNFRLRSFDGAPLAASYYPSKLGSSAPVVMLIHEMGRSRKDFEDAVLELKSQGLAEHLQGLGYAVFSMDLRGQGQNPRRALTASERPLLIEDLQAGYFFLVDRHNRGDLNLAKLGVIALGDAANLVAAWAYQPGAAVTTEGRASDLSALALISPMPEGSGYVLRHVLASLAPRVPHLLLAGERDNASKDAVQSVRPIVERARLNKVELFPSSLHGYKLLRLEPKVTASLFRFLDTSLKNRPIDWEPEYNLTPVTVGDIQTAMNAQPPEGRKAEPKAKDRAKAAAAADKRKAEAAKNQTREKTDRKQPEPGPNPAPPPPEPGKRD
jgi:alpha-beta hydrolase superfamily lysophospholipase